MKRLLLFTCFCLAFSAGNALAGASTFAANVDGDIGLSVVSTDGETSDDANVLGTTIKVPGSKKDLLIGVSIESGVFTETKVKGKNGGTDLATASGSVDITVYLDGVEVAPGTVTFNHRKQELEATFVGVLESCEDFLTLNDDGSTTGTQEEPMPDGIITVALECVVSDEMIRLLLDTTSANHFNFVAPNVGPGEHTLTVVADVTAAASADDGAAKGDAVVNIGSLTVQVVRSANTEDGIVID